MFLSNRKRGDANDNYTLRSMDVAQIESDGLLLVTDQQVPLI